MIRMMGNEVEYIRTCYENSTGHSKVLAQWLDDLKKEFWDMADAHEGKKKREQLAEPEITIGFGELRQTIDDLDKLILEFSDSRHPVHTFNPLVIDKLLEVRRKLIDVWDFNMKESSVSFDRDGWVPEEEADDAST
jgi:hypothetical protein